MIKGEDEFEGKVTIAFDPQLPHSEADKKLQLNTLRNAYDLLEDLAYLDAAIVKVKEAVDEMVEKGVKSSSKKTLDPYSVKLNDLHKSLVATRVGGITGEEQLREKLSNVYGAVMRFYGKPTQSQIDRLAVLEKELNEKQELAKPLLTSDLEKVNKILKKEGKEPIKVMSREEWEKM